VSDGCNRAGWLNRPWIALRGADRTPHSHLTAYRHRMSGDLCLSHLFSSRSRAESFLGEGGCARQSGLEPMGTDLEGDAQWCAASSAARIVTFVDAHPRFGRAGPASAFPRIYRESPQHVDFLLIPGELGSLRPMSPLLGTRFSSCGSGGVPRRKGFMSHSTAKGGERRRIRRGPIAAGSPSSIQADGTLRFLSAVPTICRPASAGRGPWILAAKP